LKNWRPITLLNTDYKIITKCIAIRLKKVLPNIIHSDQTGFLKGRFIGENIRLALDVIDYVNDNDLAGLMFLIDFEKAFDKIEWSFLFSSLKLFNFGDDLIKWVKVFYNDATSCVMNNGHASEFFNVYCGLRQGCPLSPLLYIICSEILNISIRNDTRVNGINVMNTEIILSAYADDTTLYLKDVNSLRRVTEILNSFQLYSGLKVNYDKSELLPLGLYINSPPDIMDINLNYTRDPVRLLGVTFSSNLKDIFQLNYAPKLTKLKEIIRIWSLRDLSPIGKITIIKSLGISQLVFLFSVLPKPPDNFINELNSVIYKFIWSGKPDKISRSSLIGDYEKGGLKMVHVPSIIKGLKIAWIKRLMDSNNKGNWKCLYNYHMQHVGGNLFWECNSKQNENSIKCIKNDFIAEVIKAWCTVVYEETPCYFGDHIIWNNSAIRIDNKTVYKKIWYEKGIKYISDLLENDNKYYSFVNFKNKYNISCNFLEYYSLIYAIPNSMKRSVKRGESIDSSQSDMLIQIASCTKVCKMIHHTCVDKLFKTPKAEAKWAIFF